MQKITRKRKSVLDKYYEEIKYYANIGITTPNIARLINNKANINLSDIAYRNFLFTRNIIEQK